MNIIEEILASDVTMHDERCSSDSCNCYTILRKILEKAGVKCI